ncbi:MAG: hypothetical protein Q4E65_08915 [Clostridia bacterium]|nr:hypothetical protein [Clostridia bacterium]
MKKLLIIILALGLLCAGCAGAPTAAPEATEAAATPTPVPKETPAPVVTITAPVRIEAGERKTADLNGDGREETVSILVVEDDPGAEEDETIFYFVVADDTGKETLRQCSEPYTYAAYGYVADMDADGRAELFFSQTFASDDLITKCWRSEGEAFRGLCFLESDCVTCVSDCYGLIDGFVENGVRVSAYVNVLGTRVGLRDYTLSGDVFTPAPQSAWDFTATLPADDPDTWEFYTLKTAKPLPVTMDGKPDELPAGTELLITGTDAQSSAAFVTKDGVTGSIAIAEDVATGWGWAIADVPEQDYFEEYLPYAG